MVPVNRMKIQVVQISSMTISQFQATFFQRGAVAVLTGQAPDFFLD